ARRTAATIADIMPTNLFRPIGLRELELLWDSGMKEFPQRLENQAIFYPVVNLEYARQIARDWNTPDAKSGFSGFVTKFEVSSTYLSKFELHTAGSAAHREYWIPAKELSVFNKAINGQISVEEGFFGSEFVGYQEEENGFKDFNAIEQFSALSKMAGQEDFSSQVSVHRKAIFMNCLFWLNTDISNLPCTKEQRDTFLTALVNAWEADSIGVPLPI
ncbi:MAG TPA: hypothetical protein VG272_03555, partial [Candidatus Acidoferrales bacterium]|nr:hypothetical protein [Candidatus Acidoferrales bacterium]